MFYLHSCLQMTFSCQSSAGGQNDFLKERWRAWNVKYKYVLFFCKMQYDERRVVMSLVFTPNAILEMAAISVSAMCEWRERCSRDEREFLWIDLWCEKLWGGLRVCALNTAEKNGSLLMNFLHLKCQSYCSFLTHMHFRHYKW